jgi:hypothetical protein
MKRFNWGDWGMKHSESGFYMNYADHLAALAESEKLAALRLEEINEIKRTREQEREYADVCYANEQLGKQLHAANNEIMALRGERDALKKALHARPSYYCKNCDCESCDNTRRVG